VSYWPERGRGLRQLKEDIRNLITWQANLIHLIIKSARLERISTDVLRSRLGISTDIGTEARRARLRLFRHVMRIEDESRPLKQVVTEATERSQLIKSGRPRTTWIQCVKQDLKATGVGIFTAAQIATSDGNYYKDRIVLNL